MVTQKKLSLHLVVISMEYSSTAKKKKKTITDFLNLTKRLERVETKGTHHNIVDSATGNVSCTVSGCVGLKFDWFHTELDPG